MFCFLEDIKVQRTDIIYPIDKPLNQEGAIAILKGNLAPEGAVVKHSAVPTAMQEVVLSARVFDCEEEAIAAILNHKINPGEAVFIQL